MKFFNHKIERHEVSDEKYGGPMRLGRSILAVVAGALTGIILSLCSDALLRASGLIVEGQQASDKMLFLATIYRTIYGVLGSYVAARLAPYRPMTHALVLGSIGCFVSILGTVLTWNKGPEYGQHWYPVTLIVLAIPTAWLGGKLFEMSRQATNQRINSSGL
jgi:hypothetical protein